MGLRDIKFPDVHVQLSGKDGNSFFIVGRTAMALKAAGIPEADIAQYRNEAMSGDYDNVLQTTMRWVCTS